MSAPRVVVYISGGNVQDVTVPPGVVVEIRDYDNGEDFASIEDARAEWPSCDYDEDDDGICSVATWHNESEASR